MHRNTLVSLRVWPHAKIHYWVLNTHNKWKLIANEWWFDMFQGWILKQLIRLLILLCRYTLHRPTEHLLIRNQLNVSIEFLSTTRLAFHRLWLRWLTDTSQSVLLGFRVSPNAIHKTYLPNELEFLYGFHSLPIKRRDRIQWNQCEPLNSSYHRFAEEDGLYLFQCEIRDGWRQNAMRWHKVISEHKRYVKKSQNWINRRINLE